MQIASTTPQALKPGFQTKPFTEQPAVESTPQEPTESMTFSNSSNKGAMIMLGFGVSVVGLIAGAQMDNPAVMMGGFIGGMALMVSASGR